MTLYDPALHQRRSIRLKGYDYSQPGAYFVTICVKERACLFGDVVQGKILVNDAGRMVQNAWNEIPDRYPNVEVDAFVVMPNHIHGIVVLVGAGLVPAQDRATTNTNGATIHGATTRVAPTVGDVVGGFKSITTVGYIRGVRESGWTPFLGRLWQRNYWEHIIGSDRALNAIPRYIVENPLRWHMDRYNPNAIGRDPVARDLWRLIKNDARRAVRPDGASECNARDMP
jgi:REP element-mobilizing transposase RayT